ncbi:hypothetical protein SAMN04488556_3665 [Halostagnicola kamekurae]|uniref:DUF1102 domain-containing protein n=2 Tax=Halostagnicola kamekurae TaxID=619731 RepID=A0A1I6U9Q0_9EURY|nr:hypothetical protein SAMN04488556_3665 [Halostagnicola kamekurae]
MRVTRRKTLFGLGTLAGGVGLIGASGAFDTVQAERDFDVEVADDSQALLEFTVPEDSQYVEMSGEEDEAQVVQISIGAGDDTESAGLNENATTTFDALFTIGNNGTEDVSVHFSHDIAGVTFYQGTDDDAPLDQENAATVEVGESDLDVGLKVDTGDGGYEEPDDDEVYSITVHANSED